MTLFVQEKSRKKDIKNSFSVAKKNIGCRVCGVTIESGKECFRSHNHFVPKNDIVICIPCVETIVDLVVDARNDERKKYEPY